MVFYPVFFHLLPFSKFLLQRFWYFIELKTNRFLGKRTDGPTRDAGKEKSHLPFWQPAQLGTVEVVRSKSILGYYSLKGKSNFYKPWDVKYLIWLGSYVYNFKGLQKFKVYKKTTKYQIFIWGFHI